MLFTFYVTLEIYMSFHNARANKILVVVVVVDVSSGGDVVVVE